MSPFNQKHSRDDESEESAAVGRSSSVLAEADVSVASTGQSTVQNECTSPKTQQKRLRRRGANNKPSQERQSIRSTPIIADYIPPYLRPYIHPYYGDFTFSRYFDPTLIVQLMAEGFLPMCANNQILLPKLHEQRSCIMLQPLSQSLAQSLPGESRGSLHISKSTRKRSKKYQLTFNRAWNQVIEGCQAQHGDNCWLHDSLVSSYQVIQERSKKQSATALSNGGNGSEVRPTSDEEGPCKATILESSYKCQIPVRLYSVELWAVDHSRTLEREPTAAKAGQSSKKKTKGMEPQEKQQSQQSSPPRLVAGELGYTVGAVYTSLTGYSNESSAGSVQMAALGSALQQAGFTVWDLGMDMDYKRDLGACLVERDDFLQLVHTHRVSRDCPLPHPDATPQNARVLIDAWHKKA